MNFDSDAFDISGHGLPTLERGRPQSRSELENDFVVLD